MRGEAHPGTRCTRRGWTGREAEEVEEVEEVEEGIGRRAGGDLCIPRVWSTGIVRF